MHLIVGNMMLSCFLSQRCLEAAKQPCNISLGASGLGKEGSPPQMPNTCVREPVSADTADREKEPVVV